MCGIYGFKAKKGQELTIHESGILALAMAKEMEWRGRDSWGGVVFDHPNYAAEPKIFKGLGVPSKTAHDFLLAASEAQAILGHTRTATVGKVSIPNSHPFAVGNILGVHNGSISNHYELNHKYGREFEVDSQQIFAHINEGLDLKEIEAYGTFFYAKLDEGYKNLYLARTNGGSLFLARLFRDKINKNGSNFFATAWASEKKGIEVACDYLGFNFQEVNVEPNKLYAIRENGEIYDTGKPFEVQTPTSNYKSTYRISKITQGTTEWHDHTDDPLVSTIKVVEDTICSICTCSLRMHTWRKCKLSNMSLCKTKFVNDTCKNGYKACRDCGCYLISTIHEVEIITDGVKIKCTTCKSECKPHVPFINRREINYSSANDEDSEDDSQNNLLEWCGIGLSKKAKKRQLKKIKKIVRKTSNNLVEPLPKNIRPMDSVPKCYKGNNTGPIPICPKCTCDLNDHIWGWCTNSGSKRCNNSTKDLEGICDSTLPICKDCGHHLVEGVHADAHIHELAVWCILCNNYCSGEEEETAIVRVSSPDDDENPEQANFI